MKVQIKNLKFDSGELEIYAIDGLSMNKIKLQGKTNQYILDVKDYKPGVYVLRIKMDGLEFYINKFIKL